MYLYIIRHQTAYSYVILPAIHDVYWLPSHNPNAIYQPFEIDNELYPKYNHVNSSIDILTHHLIGLNPFEYTIYEDTDTYDERCLNLILPTRSSITQRRIYYKGMSIDVCSQIDKLTEAHLRYVSPY